MKRNSIHISGLLLAFILSFTSCVRDEPGKDEPIGGEDAFIAMNLAASSMSANRALTDAEINAWENRINEIWMLLYNEKNILDYRFIWKVQNYSDASPLQLIDFYNKDKNEVVVSGTATATSFTSVGQKIKRGDYKMAVLANPNPDIFGNIVIGSDLSLLQNVIDGGQQGLSIEDFGSYAGGSSPSKLFFMSNANGLITLSKTALKSNQNEAEASPIAIHLDRLLAKVTVKEKDGGATVLSDAVMDAKRPLKWYIDVVNKRTYPIRRFAHFLGGTTMETENNSLTTNRERIYGEDPNFQLAENAEDYFSKWRNGDNPPYATWKSVDHQDPSLRTYQYTFENTMDLATQSSDDWSKFTTCIISNAYLIYKDLLDDPNDLNNEDDPGRNYYSCLLQKANNTTEWKVFTHEQANIWLKAGFPPSPDANTEEVLRLMEQKIKEVQKDFNDGITDAFDFSASAAPGKDANTYRSYKGVTYHPLGLNKYCSPIRHFPAGSSNDPRKEVYGYYGVVRNNHYMLTINSISGPGTGIYEWDNRFISAQIDITPWYRRNFQEEDLD